MISDNLLSDAFDSIVQECGLTRNQVRLLRRTSSLSSVPSVFNRINVTQKNGLVKLKHLRQHGKLALQWTKGGITTRIDHRTVPSKKPLVFAESRQELCESLPYFRSYNSGVYHHDGVRLSSV